MPVGGFAPPTSFADKIHLNYYIRIHRFLKGKISICTKSFLLHKKRVQIFHRPVKWATDRGKFNTGNMQILGKSAAAHPGHEAPTQGEHPIELGHFDGGAQLIRQIHRNGDPGAGHPHRQGPHMGDDGVGLPGAEVGAQSLGIAQGKHGVIQALVAGVGAAVGGVVQVQVVEQSRPGRLLAVPAEVLGDAVGHVGHKEGVLVTGHGKMVPPLTHGIDLLRGQQRSQAPKKLLCVG